jgi:hypothetical protein
MGRIHYPAGAPAGYPAGYPVAGYPVSGGKIGRIAGYRFCIIIKLSKVKGKYAELFLVKFFINFKIFKGKIYLNFIKFKLILFNFV